MAFRHSWEHRSRRRTWGEAQRRRQRSLAVLAAVTLVSGVLAWMIAQSAQPAAALTASRSMQTLSLGFDPAQPNQNIPKGNVFDVAMSADGEWAAMATTASLLPVDDTIGSSIDMDVYVRSIITGGVRLVTDQTHPSPPVENRFWVLTGDVDISGDGRWVTWSMRDAEPTILFFPRAPQAVGPLGDNGDEDLNTDVFIAEVDTDNDGNLNTGDSGAYLLASLQPSTFPFANLGAFDAGDPSLSYDGRYLTYSHVITSQPQAVDTLFHDRDADNDGIFDETTAAGDQTTVVIDDGGAAVARQPQISSSTDPAVDGAFVVFVAEGGSFTTSHPRVWRRSTGNSFEATAVSPSWPTGVGGVTVNAPDVNADGTRIAYQYEIVDDNLNGFDIPFGVSHILVVDLDPTVGVALDSTARVASKNPGADLASTRGDDDNGKPVLSDDGRYVAFESEASNFPGQPTTPHGENCSNITSGGDSCLVYAVDLGQDPLSVDASPTLVSVSPFGAVANGRAYQPSITGTGGRVAFLSESTNFFTPTTLVPNAFLVSWNVSVFGTPNPVTFPDTAVGASSPSVQITFDTQNFGPWESDPILLLDGYVDPARADFDLAPDSCVGRAFHAGDPCTLDVSFAPLEIGTRTATLCLPEPDSTFCQATVDVAGKAQVPDGVSTLVRESVDDNEGELPSVEGFGSTGPAISANGRYVAFETDAELDPADQNFERDIYVRDRLAGTTTLVSLGPGNVDSNGPPSREPSISGDGRFIAYSSADLKAQEAPGGQEDFSASDVFVVDRGVPDAAGNFFAAPITTLVSIGVDGQGISMDAAEPSISGDGTQVAFVVELDPPSTANVLIRDRAAGQTVAPVRPANVSDTYKPAVSADGLHVVFVGSTNLADGTTLPPTFADVAYVYDRNLDGDTLRDEPGDTRTVQVTTEALTPLGHPADQRNFALEDTSSGGPFDPGSCTGRFSGGGCGPVIDGDGTTIAYEFQQTYEFSDDPEDMSPLPSTASQIVVADRDAATGAMLAPEVVSAAGPGAIEDNAGNADSYSPDISDDGRYVSFSTEASNLSVPASRTNDADCGDEETSAPFFACDILVVDRTAPSNAAAPQLVNKLTGAVGTDVTSDAAVGQSALSGDGRFVVFDTDSTNLLGYLDPSTTQPSQSCPCPVDSNFDNDIYLLDWQPVVDPPVAELAFAQTQIGQTSAIQSAQVSTQDFGPAPVLGAALAGANAADFVITGTSNCLPPLSTAPAAPVAFVPNYGIVHLDTPCIASVAFRPTATGTRVADLVFTLGHPFSAAPASTFTVRLTGGGAAGGGTFVVDPTLVDFGSSIVTVPSLDRTVTVTNTGGTPIRVNGVSIEGTNPDGSPASGDFVIVSTDCANRFLFPGERCTVVLRFVPQAPGVRSGTLRFDDDAPGGPHLVGLTGQAPQGTLVVSPGVTIGGRTIQIFGTNWAPNQLVLITMTAPFDPTRVFRESAVVEANAFGVINATLLVLPRTISGPRSVVAIGTPPSVTASQPLLVSVATVNGPDFISRS